MDDSVKSASSLEVSVSFGRFENDVLSWEKWSSFSPNKYLEEVGNLSTPGSVARKKAYFEAHYKKIAAKKAEEMEQEKSEDPIILSPNALNKEDSFENSYEPDDCLSLTDGEKLVEECASTEPNVPILKENKDVNNDRSSEVDMSRNYNPNGLMVEVKFHEARKDDIIAFVKSESPKHDEAKNDLNFKAVSESELNVGKATVSVEPKTHPKDSPDIVEKRPARKSVKEQQTSLLKKEISKLSPRNVTQKVTPTKKEKTPTMAKKKVVSPLSKPLQAAASLCKKPTSMSTTPKSASWSSNKKANGSPIPKSNDFLVEKGKKGATTSLHMSLSFGPTNSLGGLSMTRKSLIMERMGDKDIVKRAFKTFQNHANGSLMANEKPSPVKNVSSTMLESSKVTSFHTPAKGNIGFRKDTEKTTTPRGRRGTKSNPLPLGSHKSLGLGRKSASSPSTTGFKSDDKTEKWKKATLSNEIHQRPTSS